MSLLHQPDQDSTDDDPSWLAALFVLPFFARDTIGTVNNLRNQSHILPDELERVKQEIKQIYGDPGDFSPLG